MTETFTEFCKKWNGGDSDIKITPFETADEIYWAEIRFPEQEYYCEDEEDFYDLEDRLEARSGGTITVGSSHCDFNDGILSLGIYSSNAGSDVIRVIETVKELLEEIFPSFQV